MNCFTFDEVAKELDNLGYKNLPKDTILQFCDDLNFVSGELPRRLQSRVERSNDVVPRGPGGEKTAAVVRSVSVKSKPRADRDRGDVSLISDLSSTTFDDSTASIIKRKTVRRKGGKQVVEESYIDSSRSSTPVSFIKQPPSPHNGGTTTAIPVESRTINPSRLNHPASHYNRRPATAGYSNHRTTELHRRSKGAIARPRSAGTRGGSSTLTATIDSDDEVRPNILNAALRNEAGSRDTYDEPSFISFTRGRGGRAGENFDRRPSGGAPPRDPAYLSDYSIQSQSSDPDLSFKRLPRRYTAEGERRTAAVGEEEVEGDTDADAGSIASDCERTASQMSYLVERTEPFRPRRRTMSTDEIGALARDGPFFRRQRHDSTSSSRASVSSVIWSQTPSHLRVAKTDPVARWRQYRDSWRLNLAPGEKRRRGLRWDIREKMLYVDQVVKPKHRPVFQPNSYVVPSEKKRKTLRWQVRANMAQGRLPFDD